MEAKNLTAENVEGLDTKMKELFKENPDLQWKFHDQNGIENLDKSRLDKIEEKIDQLNNKIDLIFGGAVLCVDVIEYLGLIGIFSFVHAANKRLIAIIAKVILSILFV